ncbi:MAG: prolyl oligopeptidase family serine peptidase [Woeseiaceae bacterium]|nr:prolyl oligopeptidase family serine peptidase [Woeseiaceae bacterium]
MTQPGPEAWIHGGPGGRVPAGLRSGHLVPCKPGLCDYAIDNRGSRGYGKTFRSLDRRRHGESDVLDVVASRGFLESFDWIDDNRIGVMGASYGGYLTLATITFHPDVFDAAISIVGFSDYIRNITEGGWRIPRLAAAYDEMGHPVENADMLRQKSPLFFADRISIPLFVAAGANDVRVPVEPERSPGGGCTFQRCPCGVSRLRRRGPWIPQTCQPDTSGRGVRRLSGAIPAGAGTSARLIPGRGCL